jgi:MFS family permease
MDSLLRRKYVIPFLLACIILACTQATGINSILSYLVVILLQAGMTAVRATQANFAIVVLNCVMTIVAVALIDRRGRKFLLTLGTGGIIIALVAAALFFHSFESKRIDITTQVQAAVEGNTLTLPIEALHVADGNTGTHVLTALYSYGGGSHVTSVLSNDKDPVVRIPRQNGKPLTIERASYGPVPSETIGWIITGCIALFIASFAAGPGVVVWLTLSELMPTRIRSAGMGIALLLNQGVSTLIAGAFLPIVGRYGYATMFLFWAGCTVIYFVTAAFFLPETKGRTLEEIERHFESAEAA